MGGAVFEVAFSLLYLSGLGLAPLFALRLLHGIGVRRLLDHHRPPS